MDTLDQLKFMNKITKIDYLRLDGQGYSPMHYLCSNNKEAREYFRLGKRLLQKEKMKQEKEESKTKILKNKSKRTKKEVSEEEWEEDNDDKNKSEENDHDHEENQKYFKKEFLSHRKIVDKVYLKFQDKLIEAADFLYKQGITKDFKGFDEKTFIKLAFDNKNFKLVEWLIDKKISVPTSSDFQPKKSK